jgi:hypothetical protein
VPRRHRQLPQHRTTSLQLLVSLPLRRIPIQLVLRIRDRVGCLPHMGMARLQLYRMGEPASSNSSRRAGNASRCRRGSKSAPRPADFATAANPASKSIVGRSTTSLPALCDSSARVQVRFQRPPARIRRWPVYRISLAYRRPLRRFRPASAASVPAPVVPRK